MQLITNWRKYLHEHLSDLKAYDYFKASCKTHIYSEHLEMDKHRSWSEFLINLFLAITVVGIILEKVRKDELLTFTGYVVSVFARI